MTTPVRADAARLHAYYELSGASDAERVARAITVEQTIEYPVELVSDRAILEEVIGRVERVERVNQAQCFIEVSYSPAVTGGELTQLVNVLFGNCSMWPGLRLVDFTVPDGLLAEFPGPRFGVAGIRRLAGAPNRPLLATALKPMGSSPATLAKMAFEVAAGGIDIIKDDHGLANQPYAPFAERVARCAEAIRAANDQYGTRALYLPCVNAPYEQLDARAEFALESGASGFLVLPGIVGFDAIRHLASRAELGAPIMAHPSMLGALVINPTAGIAPGLVFGELPRLAGADLSAFPHLGGRFSFSSDDCTRIGDACHSELGSTAAILPAPGGGMTLERVAEVAEFYGHDVAILIGGDLHRGNLRASAELFRNRVELAT